MAVRKWRVNNLPRFFALWRALVLSQDLLRCRHSWFYPRGFTVSAVLQPLFLFALQHQREVLSQLFGGLCILFLQGTTNSRNRTVFGTLEEPSRSPILFEWNGLLGKLTQQLRGFFLSWGFPLALVIVHTKNVL